jgi:hypothetical protein
VAGTGEIQLRDEYEARAGWQAMCRLIGVVAGGGRPDPIPPTVLTRAGESQLGAMVVEAHQFCGIDVEYSTGGYAAGGGLLFVGAAMAAGAIHDSNKRRRAEALAAPQWRPIGWVSAAVTNQRLLLMMQGTWHAHHLGNLVSILPDAARYAVTMHFDRESALMLRGPWVPWLTVVVSWAIFGRPWPNTSAPPIPILPAGPQVVQSQLQALRNPVRPALPPGPSSG